MMPARRLGGFSRLEAMVALLIIALVATVLLDRLFYYQELAEKARMEYTISRLKSGLRLKKAGLLVSGRAQDAVLLAQQNPMDWLEDKPDNYVGEFSGSDDKLHAGSWYFDMGRRELVYQLRQAEHFQTNGAGRQEVRLKIVLLVNRVDRANGSNEGDVTNSVGIELVQPYHWF